MQVFYLVIKQLIDQALPQQEQARSMYPVVLACVSVCGCLSAEAKAKTIGNLIGTDFTLYLLALACDNRLARKSNGNEERTGAENS